MIPKMLPYGQEGLAEIKKFLEENRHEGYTLSLYNILEECAAEIDCSFDEIFQIICYAVDAEHDFPAWIGVNELSESYVVGLNFTRGRIQTPAVYKAENGKLKRLYFGNEA